MSFKKIVIIIDNMDDSMSFCEQGVELEESFEDLAYNFGEGYLPTTVINEKGTVIGRIDYEEYNKENGMLSIIIDDDGKVRNLSINDRFYEMPEEVQRDMIKCVNFPCHKKWNKSKK